MAFSGRACELRVGTESRERGSVRLRKYVVTEQVTKTVPVSHEEVRIEREPITDANRDDARSGPEISEEEHEVVLHEAQPVVEKRTVPKERVRLDTDTVAHDLSEVVPVPVPTWVSSMSARSKNSVSVGLPRCRPRLPRPGPRRPQAAAKTSARRRRDAAGSAAPRRRAP